MTFPANPDLQRVKALWDEGKTTGEIGRLMFSHMKRPGQYAGDVLKRKWGVDLKRANRCRRLVVYSKAEKAEWRRMRPYMSVMEIVRRRRAEGVRVLYASVHAHCIDIKGPTEVRCMSAQQKLEARRLYRTYGWHLLDIAARLGFSECTIRKHVGETDGCHAPARKRQPNYLIHASMADIARVCLKTAA